MVSNLTVKIGADIEGLQKELNKATGQLQGFSKGMAKIGGLIAGAFAVENLIGFGKEVFNVTAEFQKFEAVLTNTLGSNSEAKKALDDITKFAASTPFQVNELTDSFVKLANAGFKPTLDQMRSLGDLAASQGKSFNQLTEAIIDAQTGEFERLKEFGIRASKEGDRVTFTFKGVKNQVDFTADSIRDYILSLGKAQGVSGGMEAISKTLGGQFSNLQDAVDQLQLALGQAAEKGGAVSTTLDLITRSIQLLTKAAKDDGVNKFFTQWFKLVTTVPRETLNLIEAVSNQLNKMSTERATEEIRKLRDELALAEIDYRAWQETGFGNRNQILQRIADISSKLEKFPTTEDPLPWATAEKSEKIKAVGDAFTTLTRALGGNQFRNGMFLDLTSQLEVATIKVGKATSDLSAGIDFSLSKVDGSLVNNQQSFASWASGVQAYTQQLAEKIETDFTPMIHNALSGIGTALGNAISGSQKLGDGLLGVLGGVLVQLGGMLITAGLGVEAFKKSLQTLQGIPAIIAGTALIAIGSAISGSIRNLGSNPTGGGSGSSSGGIGSPRTGNISGAGLEIAIGGEFRIDGDDLVYIINRKGQLNGRTR